MGDSKDKEKKGGAVPPWMTGAAKVGGRPGLGSTPLLGGAGRMGFLGKAQAFLAAPKVVVALTVAGGLALGGGLAFRQSSPRADKSKMRMAAKPADTAAAERSGDLPGVSGEAPSALALAQQANQGAMGETGEEDAADAVGEEGYDEEGDVEDEFAEGEIGEDEAAGVASEMAEGMTAEGKGSARGLGGGIGKLSSRLGGTRGGASTSASLAAGQGLGKKPGGKKGGKLSSMRKGKKGKRTKTAARSGGRRGKSGALNRLKGMNKAMSSSGKNPEVAAGTHSNQWDNATPAGGGVAGGDGGGIGNDGPGSGGTGTSGTGQPLNNNSSGGGGGGGNNTPDPGPGMNFTPYQGMVDLAVVLLGIATILMLMMGIFSDAQWLRPAAALICKIVIGIGIVVGLLGLGIMMFGQSGQGALFAGLGSMTAVFAYLTLASGTAGAKKFELSKWNTVMAFATAAMSALGALGGGVWSGGDHTAFDDGDGGDDE